MDPAVPGFLAGFLFTGLMGLWMLRSQPPVPDPAPPAEPEKDPGWCHTHNKHRDDEED